MSISIIGNSTNRLRQEFSQKTSEEAHEFMRGPESDFVVGNT